MKLLIEALFSGIIVVIVGSIIGYGLGKVMGVDLPKICKEWNKNHIMELSLFLTGFFTHILCEFSGINKIYCKKGNACL